MSDLGGYLKRLSWPTNLNPTPKPEEKSLSPICSDSSLVST
jgi:hypothetical protein